MTVHNLMRLSELQAELEPEPFPARPADEIVEARSIADDIADRTARVAQVAALHAEEVDRDARFPREAITAAKALGLMGLMAPRSLGGEEVPGGQGDDPGREGRTVPAGPGGSPTGRSRGERVHQRHRGDPVGVVDGMPQGHHTAEAVADQSAGFEGIGEGAEISGQLGQGVPAQGTFAQAVSALVVQDDVM